MKKLLKKTIPGRALIPCLSLAALMVLALAAVAGAAEAKKGGVPSLKKGVTNLVETATALAGFVADGPVLKLDNNSTTADATALDLQVEPGKAPLTVSEGAGKATNLDADKLDGKDSTEFLNVDGKAPDADRLDGKDSTEFLGANDKAADADKLDGKDSTEFLAANGKAADSELLDGKDSKAFFAGETYVVKETGDGFQQGNGEIIVASADCDPGDRVLGGGGFVGDEEEDIQVGEGPNFDTNSNGWITFVRDEGDPTPAVATALCADFGEPHQD